MESGSQPTHDLLKSGLLLTVALATATTAGVVWESSMTLAVVAMVATGGVVAVLSRSALQDRTKRNQAGLPVGVDTGRDQQELLTQLSVDMREPLSGIDKFVAGLLNGDIERERTVGLIEAVEAESKTITRKLEDLLTLSRIQTATLEFIFTTMDVANAIEDALLAVGMDNATLDIERGTYAVADPRRTHHVLRNLFQNAIDHGGTDVRVSTILSNDTISIAIEDDGPGLTEISTSMFDPYAKSRAGSAINGIGLGLAVAHRLSEAMHGRLTYNRAAGVTRMTLALPRSRVRYPIEA